MVAEAVARILGSGIDFYLTATGAGAGLQHLIWQVPGSSAGLVGASFPYAKSDTDDFLGFTPDHYCSEETAIELASAAFVRAKAKGIQAGAERPAVGIGLTASVASTTPHQGDHRIHSAVVCGRGVFTWSAMLEKGVGEAARQHDGDLADRMGLDLLHFATIGETAGLVRRPFTLVNAVPEATTFFFRQPIFAAGRRFTGEHVPHHPVLFPGTFNPLHHGHRAMTETASHAADRPILYIVNADSPHKSHLGVVDLLTRAAMFRSERDPGCAGVLFTKGQPLFVDKARAFPGATFILGADTLARLLDPQWGVPSKTVLQTILEQRVRLFIFDRGERSIPQILDAQPFPTAQYRRMFVQLAGSWDVSSTKIRTERTWKTP